MTAAVILGVPLRGDAWVDPRMSKSQVEALSAVVVVDHKARVLGLDRRYRPVVQADLGMPRQRRVWAVQRNGDPIDPDWDETLALGDQAAALAEAWWHR